MDPIIEEFRQQLIEQSPLASESTEVDIHGQVIEISESLTDLIQTLSAMHETVDHPDVEYQVALWMGEMSAALRSVDCFATYIEEINATYDNVQSTDETSTEE